jgi:FkbM family methyltransferase
MDKRLIKKLVKKDNPTILEIGTHKGSDSLGFLQSFPQIRLYCFEPDPRAIAKHKNLIQDPRCQLFEVAISDRDGTATFYQSDGRNQKGHTFDASSSLKVPKEHLEIYPDCKFEEKITVKTTKLDTWLAEHPLPEIDFIWADVQGAEKELILGGMQTLSKTKYFFTEFNNREIYEGQINLPGIKQLLPDFKVICLFDNNVLLKNLKFIKNGIVEIVSERALTNTFIYQNNRSSFHFPLNTGLRKFLPK